MVQGSNENFRESDELRRDHPVNSNRFATDSDENDDSDRATDVIRAEIDRTRAEMDHTVDALQARLDPQALVHDFLDSFRNNAGDFAHRGLNIVKASPIPAALIGIGVAWLIVDLTRKNKKSTSHHRPGRDLHQDYTAFQRHAPQPGGAEGVSSAGGHSHIDVHVEDTLEQSSSRISMAALRDEPSGGGCGCGGASSHESFAAASHSGRRNRSETGGSQTSKRTGRNIRSQAMHRMQDMRGFVGEKASQVGQQLQYGTSRAKDWFEQTVDEYPLAVGAAFFTLGLIGGFAIPATTPENRYLGKTRDQLFNQAQEYGSELLDKGQEVAEKVVQQVKESIGSSESSDSGGRSQGSRSQTNRL